MVEPGDDDLVARAERAPDGGREPHRHRGHRRPEGDAARLGAEQPGDRVARGLDAGVGRVRGGEHAAVVGVVARAHERGHRVDRAVDHLRAGGAVEPRPAAGEPGEAVAVHSRAPAARTSSRVVRVGQQRGRRLHVQPAHLVDLVVRREGRRPPAP